MRAGCVGMLGGSLPYRNFFSAGTTAFFESGAPLCMLIGSVTNNLTGQFTLSTPPHFATWGKKNNQDDHFEYHQLGCWDLRGNCFCDQESPIHRPIDWGVATTDVCREWRFAIGNGLVVRKQSAHRVIKRSGIFWNGIQYVQQKYQTTASQNCHD
jgi:hypothetical protein